MGKDTKLCLQHKIHLRQQYPRDVAPLCMQEILIVRKSYVQAIHVSGCVGPEEMCLSLEHQNPSKTSEIMGYFDRVDDRVTVSLHILYTANQETEGSQDRLTVCLGRPSGDVPCASEAMACGY